MAIYVSLNERVTVWQVDGGLDSDLPEEGGKDVLEHTQTILAGRQGLFISGTVDADGPTVVTVADVEPDAGLGLQLQYQGDLEILEGEIRLLNTTGREYWRMDIDSPVVSVAVWVDYPPEPGVIWLRVFSSKYSG